MKHEWKQYEGKTDVIVGGSPCQSFSIAGQRLGMDDPRGNLALHYLRIVREVKPSWFVFENVPGLLSSNGGEDFAIFLGEVAKCGYGFAYRILDAQHFGVPQRRRRVFVVGCADGDWRSAASVLFERQGVCGNSQAGRKEEQSPSFPIGTGIEFQDNIVAPSLTASNNPSRSPQSNEVTEQVTAVFKASSIVRRLTPIECERLQGFPDNYTQIPWKGKEAKDCPNGPRYKAMGNSMAVPVMEWIGMRIQAVNSIRRTIQREESKTSRQMQLW